MMDEHRVSPLLKVLTALAAVLGTAMALEGLYARLFGSFFLLAGFLGLWGRVSTELQLGGIELTAQGLAWPLVVVGTMWSGALLALWLRLGWGYRACVILGIASLGYIGVGSLLAAGVLLLLRSIQVRQWTMAGSMGDVG
jgi:hypothetical protein